MYTALEIAKYIVYKCIKDKNPITNLQLQKILYYLRCEFLRRGEDIFSDDFEVRKGQDIFLDDFEAWRLGPVIPNVYYHFCGHGSLPIDIYFDEWKYIDFGNDYRNIIDRVVEDKRTITPWDMVADTQTKCGAWGVTYADGAGFKKVIDAKLIEKEVNS